MLCSAVPAMAFVSERSNHTVASATWDLREPSVKLMIFWARLQRSRSLDLIVCTYRLNNKPVFIIL